MIKMTYIDPGIFINKKVTITLDELPDDPYELAKRVLSAADELLGCVGFDPECSADNEIIIKAAKCVWMGFD